MTFADYRRPLIAAGALVAGVAALQLWRLTAAEQLWGTLPLFFLGGAWLAIVAWRQAPERAGCLGWATVAGGALGISLAPYGAVWAPIVGFAALLHLVDRLHAAGASKRQALWYAYHAMVVFNVGATWWVANTALAAGLVANFLNAFFQAVVVLLVYRARVRLPRHWLASAVALWIGFEFLHFDWEIAWPWLCLGHTFAAAPALAQWFSWTGVFGGSLYVTAAGACGYVLLRWPSALAHTDESAQSRAAPRALAQAAAFAFALPLLGSLVYFLTAEQASGPRVRVAAVQPNYEPHYRKFAVRREEQLRQFDRLTAEALAAGAELVIYPETSFGGVDEERVESEAFYGMWRAQQAAYPRADLLTGLSSYRRLPGPTDDPALRTQRRPGGGAAYYIAHNSALAIEGETRAGLYYKSKLVPGVEFLPYRRLLFFFEPLVASLGGTTAGLGRSDSVAVFRYGSGVGAAPLICYESLYGDYVRAFVRRGANLLVVPTNDGWWDDSPGYRQHFNLARLRAIETRRWVVQAANSGTSGFVDERGRAFAKSDYDEAAVTLHDVRLLGGETPYVRFGDVLGYGAAAGALLTLGALVVVRIRGRG